MDSRGTIKILDGIYVGDESSSRDEELILPTHITLIINLTDLPNYYEHYDIRYIVKQWPPQDFNNLIDGIEAVRAQGQSTLLHGGSNLDHPVTAIAVYLMNRFRWSLFKTLQFLNLRVRGLKFSLESFELLKREELNLLRRQIRLSYNWDIRSNDSEQLVLRNTYLNSQAKEQCSIAPPSKPASKKKKRISWKIIQSPVEEKHIASGQVRSASLRNQIMLSLRKITNSKQTLSKHSTEISLIQKQYQIPSLTKHKSSYMFASLPSLQNIEKPKEIPVATLQLSEITGFDNRSASLKKKAKTEINEESVLTINQYTRFDDVDRQWIGRVDSQKLGSNGLKKAKRKYQLQKKAEKPSSHSTILLR